jgi:hypothetical protein
MKYIFVLLLGLFALQLSAQESTEPIEVSLADVQKANERVTEELEKLNKRLRKKLGKQYPDFTVDQLDSLIESSIQEGKEKAKQTIKDTVVNYLQQTKESLLQDLRQTPEKLPVSEEIATNLQRLDELSMLKLQFNSVEDFEQLLQLKDLKHLKKQVDVLKKEFAQYKAYFKDWEKHLVQEIENLPQMKLVGAEVQKMKAYTPLPPDYRQNIDQLQSNDFVQKQLKQKAEELQQEGEELLQEKFNQAVAKINTAKKEFPSLQSVENAPKRFNPYQGMPTLNRLKFGFNLQYNREKPWSIDYALNLAYPLNKRMRIGAEGAGRIFFEKPAVNETKKDLLSIRPFFRYEIWKSIFLQANYEINQMVISPPNDAPTYKDWKQTGLIGIGKSFSISKRLRMSTIMFYDFFPHWS